MPPKKKKLVTSCDPRDRRCFFIGPARGVCDRHAAQDAQQRRTNFKVMGYPEIRGADAGDVCPDCKQRYDEHPMSSDWLDMNGELWLHRLCSGESVFLQGGSLVVKGG